MGTAADLFAAHGYDDTTIEAVLEETGVSRGSLYHHFSSKQALFEAVVDRIEAQVGEDLTAEVLATGDPDPANALRAACLAWVRLAGEPVVRRVLLIDAPAVLGWRRWREIEEQYALGTTRAVVQMAADEGRIPHEVVDPISHMVLAAVNELALMIALSDDVPGAQASAQAAVDEFFQRLLPPPAKTRRRR